MLTGRLQVERPLGEPSDTGQNLVRGFRPDEWCALGVMRVDELANRGFQRADAPELPGCMAHGDSQETALKRINKAIQLWIDTASEFGDPIPQPKGERLMFA